MSVSRMRHAAFGVAAAGVVAAGLLTGVGHDLQSAQHLQAAEPAAPETAPADRDGSKVRVEAPGAAVNVDRERGRVTVRAPHTDVDVDPDKGEVKVRAPYVNLDIRW
jgi:phage baseplate assembly protein gpV